jgi:hypothetical protein
VAPGIAQPIAAAPEAAAPSFEAPAAPSRGAYSPELAGAATTVEGIPELLTRTIVQGDQSPFTFLRVASVHAAQVPQPPTPPGPPVPGQPRPGRERAAVLVPWARGFKIADNMSPRPQDRVFATFNYFNNINYDINRRLGGTFQNVAAYRQLYGFEKTFLEGDASFGLRVPVNTLTADSPVRGLTPTRTSWGNLTAFTKFIVWRDEAAANLISTGLAVTVPNGPATFGGAPYVAGIRDVAIQPFLGYFFSQGRLYFQGFESIDVPTDSRDVTILYNDVAVGYFIYQAADPRSFLSGIAPTFETHVNVPLNHQGSLRPGDPFATPYVVDLTFGVNFFFSNLGTISAGFVDPVTGPRPFNYEWTFLFNVYYGRTRASRLRMTPGVLGG